MTEQRDDKTFYTTRVPDDTENFKRGQEIVSPKKIDVDTSPPPAPPPPPASDE